MPKDSFSDADVAKALAGERVQLSLPAGTVLQMRRGRSRLVIDKLVEGVYNKRTATVGEEGRPTGRSN